MRLLCHCFAMNYQQEYHVFTHSRGRARGNAQKLGGVHALINSQGSLPEFRN